jgi:hypothetical protein
MEVLGQPFYLHALTLARGTGREGGKPGIAPSSPLIVFVSVARVYAATENDKFKVNVVCNNRETTADFYHLL